jgi:hypothetical protein
MKRGFFCVRPLDLLPYCSQSLLIGDHPRQALVAVYLGVEFDALLAHSAPRSERAFINANAVRWSAVPSANANAKSSDLRLSATNGADSTRPRARLSLSKERSKTTWYRRQKDKAMSERREMKNSSSSKGDRALELYEKGLGNTVIAERPLMVLE